MKRDVKRYGTFVVGLALLWPGVSIAGAPAHGHQALPVRAAEMISCDPSPYDERRLTVIMKMRDNGESLAAVAKVVGGTRETVKEAERLELARRRGADRAGRSRLACAPLEAAR